MIFAAGTGNHATQTFFTTDTSAAALRGTESRAEDCIKVQKPNELRVEKYELF